VTELKLYVFVVGWFLLVLLKRSYE